MSNYSRLQNTTQHDYFSTVDRPVQAYILGLLASDGNVHGNRPIVRLCMCDFEAVELMRTEIVPQTQLSVDNRNPIKPAFIVSVFSRQIVADLTTYGITPRKSFSLTWPDNLDSLLWPAYTLGYFDGDGSLFRYQSRGHAYWRAKFTSASLLFISRLQDVLKGAGINSYLGKPRQNAYNLLVQGSYVYKLDAWMHECGLGLPRKSLAFREVGR